MNHQRQKVLGTFIRLKAQTSLQRVSTLLCALVFSHAHAPQAFANTQNGMPSAAEFADAVAQKLASQSKAIATLPPVGAGGVFGSNLFWGNFASESVSAFDPNHIITVGSVITVKIWGLFDFQGNLVVDEQGNIFLPRVGPVGVQGVTNKDLTKVVESKIRTVYQGNIGVYCNLAVAQPVRLFVAGSVLAPGVYAGTSSDSVLRFLDRARGIDAQKGSFLKIDVLRRGKILRTYNLYDFVKTGSLVPTQFVDGDTILVHPRQSTVTVTGEVQNANQFEFVGRTTTAGEVLKLAVAQPQASHVRIINREGGVEKVAYLSVADAQNAVVTANSEIDVIAERKTETIAIRVEGEHKGEQVVVVPYGSTLAAALKQISWMDTSNRSAVQLFRASVREAQRTAIANALDRLEKTILTTQSQSADEAKIREGEAKIFLQWIEKARKVEPKGQVVIDQDSDKILLEPGDVLRIPRVSDVVTVTGEVNFPTSFAFVKGRRLSTYVSMAGGFNEYGTSDRVVILRPNGSFENATMHWFWQTSLEAGDQVISLPEIKTKYIQVAKDITQILYQIAISAGVALKII